METFNSDGSYNKTEWKNGDIITADKLNKIEDALYEINDDNNNFATKDEIPVIPTNVSAFANDAKYVTRSEVPVVPTKMSDLTNDAGYVTQYHSHDNYVSKTYVDNAIAGIDVPEVDLSNYVTKSEIPTVPTKTSDLTNDSNFITSVPSEYITETELSNKNYADKSYVTNAINNAQLGGGDGSGIDLSIYATKDDLANIADTIDMPTKTSQLDNDSGFLTSIPLEYVTETELTAKDYATKSYVTDAINSAQINVDLSDYALKTDIPTVPTNVSELNNDSGYITGTIVDNKINNAMSNINLSDYALKSEIPTKASQLENDVKYALRSELYDYASKTEIPNKVSELVNDKNYVTNDEMTSALNNKVDSSVLNNYALKTDIPTKVSTFTNDKNYVASNGIVRIELVTDYPETSEPGVLYIKVSEL